MMLVITSTEVRTISVNKGSLWEIAQDSKREGHELDHWKPTDIDRSPQKRKP